MNRMITIDQLSSQWLAAKEIERQAVESRRELEDRMASMLGISETDEGTSNFDLNGHNVKVVSRLNRKIDTDKLQEIAMDNGLSEHLGALFRWKAEINTASWRNAAESITSPLLAAITTTPGRPSFSITSKEV